MQPVDVNSKWHVDHIVPISKGGPHSYLNVQLAHAKCNRTKGAKCA
jgi:5-methylcytosine-specific restriction endonuclease McrA